MTEMLRIDMNGSLVFVVGTILLCHFVEGQISDVIYEYVRISAFCVVVNYGILFSILIMVMIMINFVQETFFICDMIKGNESDVAYTVYGIL